MNGTLVTSLRQLNAVIAWLIVLGMTAFFGLMPGLQGIGIIIGFVAGLLAATIICGLLATLLQIEVNTRRSADAAERTAAHFERIAKARAEGARTAPGQAAG